MMTVSRKERMRCALRHEPVDRIPTQINYTRAMGQRLAAHLDTTPDRLPERLDNHLLRVDIAHERRRSEDGRITFDWWGVGFDTRQEGYLVAVYPLADSRDLDAFAWPDPEAPGLLDEAARTIEQDGGARLVVPNLGFALFERAWTLRGFERFLLDMADNPGFASDLLERITEIQLVLIRRFLEMGVDGGYFGDDYGAQNNLLFSPRMWRTLIKPRLARMFAPFREAGLPVILHSDGQIAAILPDLVEIGLTAINPVQPEVIGHAWLRRTFGNRLACYGGVSTQTVLPQGSPQQVRQAVADCLATLAPEGTGLVLAPSHRLMTDVPMENVEALLEAMTASENLPATASAETGSPVGSTRRARNRQRIKPAGHGMLQGCRGIGATSGDDPELGRAGWQAARTVRSV
ncbi:MAG: uroporphyrinogen decarboxylase family protein [Anaerolineae bacterium]|jgi:uroporphyrinogen decarboxylase